MTRLTNAEINEAIKELDNISCEAQRITAKNDIKAGYRDRMLGYYDKWYRYNKRDEGAAYDKGVQLAIKRKTCEPDMRIIPA